MKKILLAVIPFLILATWSCTRDDDRPPRQDPQLSFIFVPFYENSEVEIGKRFENQDGYPIDLHNLAFYLSDVALITKDNNVVALSDIEIIHLRNNHRSLTFTIPAGDYAGFKFNLGVPSALNSPSNPEFSIGAFDANHPLSESNGMFWDWQGGYRHFSIDGHCDTIANNGEFLPLSFGFHTGHDTLYRVLPPFEHPFQISHNDLKHIEMRINLKTLFKNNGNHIDLKAERQYHGSDVLLDLGIKIADNSAAAFEIKH